MEKPFVYGVSVEGKHFTDRELETKREQPIKSGLRSYGGLRLLTSFLSDPDVTTKMRKNNNSYGGKFLFSFDNTKKSTTFAPNRYNI